jgi:hypothetical protein
MNGFVQEQGQMELITGRPHKGLVLLPLYRDVTTASVRIEGGGGTRQFIAKLSLYLIHLVSDISCETDRSIHFLPVFDCAGLTRSPP